MVVVCMRIVAYEFLSVEHPPFPVLSCYRLHLSFLILTFQHHRLIHTYIHTYITQHIIIIMVNKQANL